MQMKTLQQYASVPVEECRRCGHRWIRQKAHIRVCPFPGCKSPYWDVEPRPGRPTDAARARHAENCHSVICEGDKVTGSENN